MLTLIDMVTVYLAHPFLEKVRGADLQKKIEALGIEVINPFVRVEQAVYEKVIDNNGRFTQKHLHDIVEGDLRKIEEADGVVALVTGKSSAGTHMEVFYASRILHRPVFVLYEFRLEGRSLHPWYEYLTQCSTTEEELLKVLSGWSAREYGS